MKNKNLQVHTQPSENMPELNIDDIDTLMDFFVLLIETDKKEREGKDD